MYMFLQPFHTPPDDTQTISEKMAADVPHKREIKGAYFGRGGALIL